MKKSDMPRSSNEPECLHDAAVPDLELPDAPDFVSKRSPRSLAQMLVFLEEFRQWEPVKKYQKRQERCLVEFVL